MTLRNFSDPCQEIPRTARLPPKKRKEQEGGADSNDTDRTCKIEMHPIKCLLLSRTAFLVVRLKNGGGQNCTYLIK